MAFKFRLETLLRLRERQLELAEGELASFLKQLASARNSHDIKLTEVRQAESALKESLSKGVEAERYRQMSLYLERLKADLARLEQRISQIEAAVAQAREKVMDRHREKELVEKLREKEYQAYTAEIQRQEQVEADDLSSVGFVRREHEKQLI